MRKILFYFLSVYCNVNCVGEEGAGGGGDQAGGGGEGGALQQHEQDGALQDHQPCRETLRSDDGPYL